MFRRQRKNSVRGLDMTRGPLVSQMLRFALPLMLSGILQLAYTSADSIVVGQFAGAQALAAVGSTSALINLVVSLFIGIASGAGVAVARSYGAGDARKISENVHTAITLSLVSGFAVMLLGQLTARPLLHMMDTPADVIDMAEVYLRIYFAGMPVSMLYNFGAEILRAIGDTKRPLYFLTLSGIVNVVLNLVLVIVFRMNVAGVGIATVASQVVSAALVTRCLMGSDGPAHLDLRKLRLKAECVRDMLHIGIPSGLQSIVFSISNVQIQSTINSFGSLVMAANTAARDIEHFASVSQNALAQAMVTTTSQNMGARQYARVRKSLWSGIGLMTVVCLSISSLMMVFARPLLSLYNPNPEVIEFGVRRMAIMVTTTFLGGWMSAFSGQLRGTGYSVMPMIVTLIGACLLRVLWIQFLFPLNPTLEMVYISYPISWLLTTIVHFICYRLTALKKLPKENEALPA